MEISSFCIQGLFGYKNIEIPIIDNRLLIVAENGAGKTILLRLFYLFFSKQWNALEEYDFSKISAVVNNKEYEFIKANYRTETIQEEIIDKLCKAYPGYRTFLTEHLRKYNADDLLSNEHLIVDIESKYDVPKSLLFRIWNELSSHRNEETTYDWTGIFLYLPTYRRIERGFQHLYGDINDRLEQHIRQLFPDLERKIQSEKSVSTSGQSETENDLRSLFNDIWSTREYERWGINKPNFHFELIEFGIDDVQYRISKILEKTSQLDDMKVAQYLKKCNNYLTENKKLVISANKNKIEVICEDNSNILSLSTLSAGEKQIISLFSYLVLNPEQTWVIIDEPELSLSMSWQESLLDDIIDFKTEGILAATHSPFIVTSNFRQYTHGINEFEVRR